MSLLAPATAGGALLGPGPGEVEAVISWEAASVASLFGGEREYVDPAARAALSPFDAVVAYTASRDLLHTLGATGARVVVHSPHPPPGGPHAARWLAEAVAVLGADVSTSPPVLQATPSEEGEARRWLDRLGAGFLAIHAGSGSSGKNWPAERFGSVVSGLAGRARWLLVEGPADAAATSGLARLPSVVHARDLPVRILGALLARAGLYVGNDSGVTHVAAAWGAPVLALFGPTDPAVWAPVGPRVTVRRSDDGAMDGLTVEAVLAAARARAP